ncbi:MAG: undecaprenyldiphospho-muramoylpentapeptide beta-N-acetylglucosaminyltransferase [Patescibacteria group bacterium]
MKERKIIFTGGGTGGHVFPLVAVIRSLKDQFPSNEKLNMFYIAPKDNIPDFNFTQEGLKTKYILAGKLRRYIDPISIFLNIIDIIKIPLGIVQAIFHLFVISPDMVFSKGGYGSVPVAIAASILRIPIILHESDATPGLANKIVSKFATEVFVSFQDTENINPGKKFVVGNPIRKSVLDGDFEQGVNRFNLKKGKPVLLVLGGSQGSERINDTILAVLTQLLEEFEIIHQCGRDNIEKIREETEAFLPEELKGFYHPYAFFDENQMKDAYAVASLVVSRAGAGSIFEIIANNKPSILIPLPEAAQNHQAENAYRVARVGATIVMEEENLTPHFFLEKVKSLFSPPTQLAEMKENSKYFSKPDAGHVLAAYIKEFLIR